jgi:hypothetical protein
MKLSLIRSLRFALSAAAAIACAGVVACSSGSGSHGSTSSSGGPTTCGPIQATNDYGTACLQELQGNCPDDLAACEADCDCAAFTDDCINGTSGPDPSGAVECESSAQTPHIAAIFTCMDNPFAKGGNSCKLSQVKDAGGPPVPVHDAGNPG